MAFETFLTVDKLKPRKGRRITFLVSLAVHGVMLAVGVAMSFAGVDELAPKNGTLVTFRDLPTPPPPPAGKKQHNKPKPKPVAKTVRLPNTPVLPMEKTQPEKAVEPDGDDPNGEENGKLGSRGIGPDVGGEPPVPHPPNVTKGFLDIDPQAPAHRPRMPPRHRTAGTSVWALMRICTDRDGNVIEVKVLKGDEDPAVTDAFVSAVRTWRYKPFKVNGRSVPFCTNVRYEVQTSY
jgi:TonB family protein